MQPATLVRPAGPSLPERCLSKVTNRPGRRHEDTPGPTATAAEGSQAGGRLLRTDGRAWPVGGGIHG